LRISLMSGNEKAVVIVLSGEGDKVIWGFFRIKCPLRIQIITIQKNP